MKFYTDPTYFFELWCHEMQKDTELQKKELKQRRKNRVNVMHPYIVHVGSLVPVNVYMYYIQVFVKQKDIVVVVLVVVMVVDVVRWWWL